MVLLEITSPVLQEIAPVSEITVEDSLFEYEFLKNDTDSACGGIEETETEDAEKETGPGEDAPFKITPLAGKGTGMVATRTLYPGDLILAEKPMLYVPDEIYEDIEETEKLLDKQVLALTPDERELVFNLTDSRDPLDPSYLGVFYTNDMNYDGDAVLCPVMARANHSCRPNAEFVTRKDLGIQHLVTMYLIKEGEEVLINYMAQKDEGSETRDVRRSYLREWYDFQCLCRACTLDDEELREDDAIREDMKELQSAGEENLSSEEVKTLIGWTYQTQGKLSYILFLMEVLYKKAEGDNTLLMLEYAVQGLAVAMNLYGEDFEEVKKWLKRSNLLDEEKMLVLWARCQG